MRKLALVLLVVTVAFAGCRKDGNNDQPNDGLVDVSFNATQGLNLKDGTDTECFNVRGDYANVVISGETYTLDVFYLGDSIPYTQTIKLPVGATYSIDEFMLMDNNNTPLDTSDDYAIMAAPHEGSDFAGYVQNALNIEFTLESFDKLELAVEVLCYEEAEFDSFGFVYFEFDEIIVRQLCLFGDLCIKGLEDYQGSLYDNEPSGLQYDMPAIFAIEVWRNGVRIDSVSNVYNEDGTFWLGVGSPLCVWYPDRKQETDEFELKLYVYVDDGPDFSFKYFHSWEFTDVAPSEWDVEGDGVVDFVLGSCVVGADFAFLPYMDLPPSCVLRFDAPFNPGPLGTYFDLQLSGIPAGYDLTNGTWEGWCAQDEEFISAGTNYNMDIYSSLYEDKLPPQAQGRNWEEINWLFNNMDWYEGETGYSWKAIQRAIWKIVNDDVNFTASLSLTAAEEAMAVTMYNDAFSYGEDFIPLPGYWAAVVFVDQDDPDNVQVVFTIVDP